MELSIDVETYSDCPIKYGAQRYVDDTTFEILLFAYSFDDEPVEVIDMRKDPLPERVVDALYNKEITKTAFNAAFEMLCLKSTSLMRITRTGNVRRYLPCTVAYRLASTMCLRL